MKRISLYTIPLVFVSFFWQTSVFAQWQKVNSANGNILDLLINDGNLYAAGAGVLKSTDYGLTWQKILPMVNEFASFVYAVGDTVVASTNEQLFLSIDDGLHWDTLSLPAGIGDCCVRNVIFYHQHLYFADFPKVYSKHIDDNTWVEWMPPTGGVFDLKIAAGKVWLRAQYGGIYNTINHGMTWEQVFSGYILFYTVKEDTLVVGHNDSLYVSVNGGMSWNVKPYYFPNDYDPTDVTFIEGKLYAFRSNWLYESDDLGDSWHLLYDDIYEHNLASNVVKTGNIYFLPTNKGCLRSDDNASTWYFTNGGMGASSGTRLTSVNNHLIANDVNYSFSMSATDGQAWFAPNVLLHQANAVVQVNDDLYGLFEGKGLYKCVGSNLRYWNYLNGNFFLMWGDELLFHQGAMFTLFDGEVRRSTDNALTWTQTGNLPGSGFYIASFNNQLYTYDNLSGISRSSNLGASWEEFNFDLKLPPNHRYVMQSHGDSLFILDHDTGLYVVDTFGEFTHVAADLMAFPNFSWSQVDFMEVSDAGILILRDNVLYYSADYGTSWTDFKEGLDSNEVIVSITSTFDAFYLSGFRGNIYKRTFESLQLFEVGGKINEDVNNNNLSDVGEPGIHGIVLYASLNNGYAVSDTSGHYQLLLQNIPDTIIAIPSYPWIEIEPAFQVFDTIQTWLDFQIQYTSGIFDLQASITNHAPFRPGFPVCMTLTYENYGTETQNGLVRLSVNAPYDNIFFDPMPLMFIGDTAIWSFDSLEMLENENVVICLTLPATTELGEIISFFTAITSQEEDIHPEDNTFLLVDEVVGSFDPNDKQVSPEAFTIEHASGQEELTYTVRFQNTGTYPASFVHITDTLSQNLNPATIRIVSSSHPLTWNMEGVGILQFHFDDIQLPDSASNEPGSHGFVKYAIRTDSTIQLNDIINNTAYIYFDFNSPVVTNTVSTQITSPVTETDNDGDAFSVTDGDCDDSDPTSFPSAPELCDGLDNNCNEYIPNIEIDMDSDGLSTCQGDCNDMDVTTYPGVLEACDGFDNDCDGLLPAIELDTDNDSYTPCEGDCDDTNSAIYSGATETCDGFDTDCEGTLSFDEMDQDGDSFTMCAGDCDESNADIYPGAAESCNGLDDDCDGALSASEMDADSDGYTFCDNDCDDTNEAVNPGATEICDGYDNDCNGVFFPEEIDADSDGYLFCNDDCDDTDDAIFPGAPETPNNGIDEDCDGIDLIIDATSEAVKNQIHVVPNPFSNNIVLTCNTNEPLRYVLLDALGRSMDIGFIPLHTPRMEMDGRLLPPGIYFLLITDMNNTHIFRQRLTKVE